MSAYSALTLMRDYHSVFSSTQRRDMSSDICSAGSMASLNTWRCYIVSFIYTKQIHVDQNRAGEIVRPSTTLTYPKIVLMHKPLKNSKWTPITHIVTPDIRNVPGHLFPSSFAQSTCSRGINLEAIV